MRAANQPVSWWGWHWQPPVPMSLVEILQAGNMPPRLAAMFWLAMERGASLIVAADPPSAGKTATLTALLSLAPPETVAYFTRGMGETFSLPPRTDAHPTYMLVNEMSDHLPVYTWDSYARRAFELMAEGYSLATTVHANTVDEVLAILREEIGVPPDQIARLTFIAPLHLSYGPEGPHSARRRVSEVAFLRPHAADGFAYRSIVRWDADTDRFAILESAEDREALAAWCGISADALLSELDKREGFLTRLVENGMSSIPEVNAAIERFYAEEIRPRRSA
jgi:type IV secretory pathway ATPase VirB11/archaellum biosynthesis ATPase